MGFSLSLEGRESEVILSAQDEDEEKSVRLRTTFLAFVPWSILFRDFLRLLYWIPHSDRLLRNVMDFFREAFVFPDESGEETRFRLEQEAGRSFAQLFVWQPSRTQEPTLSIQEGAALSFANLLALSLFQRGASSFLVESVSLEEEDLFQFHGEIRRIEDEVRASGLGAYWLTQEIQRLMVVGRAYDLGLPAPDGIPSPLLRAAEEKVLSPWGKPDFERLLQFLSSLEQRWHQETAEAPRDSGEMLVALENWIFLLNLLGFVDRFLAGLLPTRLPNPITPLLSFLLERFFIAQWESDLWALRRSALEENYRALIPFLLS